MLPAGSVARTSNVCGPSPNGPTLYGLSHCCQSSLSSLHSNSTPASLVNAKCALVLELVEGGASVMVTRGGVVSTVIVRLAGLASVLPVWSVARASKVCGPSVSAAVVCGEVQAVNASVSTRHWKLAPDSLPNANVAVGSPVRPSGPALIVVWGALVSTVMVRLAGLASVLPAASVARTSKVWGPSVSAAVVCGELQAVSAAESTRHSNVALDSEENSNVGVESPVSPLAPVSMVVSGGVVSIVQVWLAGVGSTLSAASMARTSNVCGPSTRSAKCLGASQGAKPPAASLSRRHSNRVCPAEVVSSLAMKPKLAEELLLKAGGLIVSAVSGGVVSGSVVSSVKVRLAGVASVLPAASVARTEKVCGPSVSVAVVCGELHAVKASLSTRHSKLAPGSDEKSNVGVASRVNPVGPASIVVSGGIVSTVNVRVAAVVSVLPAASVPDVERVGRRQRGGGRVQVVKTALSTRHSNVAPGSEELIRRGRVAGEPLGPASIVVSGAVVSTVNVRVAGLASVLPTASVARTSTVCGPSGKPVGV